MDDNCGGCLLSAGSASPKLDTSVEDRLALEKKEAEEKARAAEREAEERERIRKERLESEKALKGIPSPAPPTPSTSAVTGWGSNPGMYSDVWAVTAVQQNVSGELVAGRNSLTFGQCDR